MVWASDRSDIAFGGVRGIVYRLGFSAGMGHGFAILCSVALMGALNVGIAEEGIVTGRFFYARKKRAYARSETRT